MKLRFSFGNFGGVREGIEGKFIGLNGLICVNLNRRVGWALRSILCLMTLS